MEAVSAKVFLIGEKNSQRLALAKDLSREEKRAVFDMVRCGGFSLRQVARHFGITEVDAMDAFLDHLERWHNREVEMAFQAGKRSMLPARAAFGLVEMRRAA